MMRKPTKCYAVTCGRYSDYQVIAIYRRREDAKSCCEQNNSAPKWLLDGVPVGDEVWSMDRESVRRVKGNPARQELDDLRIEEFNYYESEPLPAPPKGKKR